jgi:O-antigen/teichoic acid export membrane protein
MKYEIQNDSLNSITKQFVQSTLIWKKAKLFIVFGVLLTLVILGCSIGPSPFVAVALIGTLTIVLLSALQPRFALLLVFIGAGLPALLLPLPGHNMRPIEAALLLCLLSIFINRPHLRLLLPHLLALLFVAIAFISFIHVPEFSKNVNDYTAENKLYMLFLVLIAFFCGTFLVKYVKDASSFLVIVLLCNIPLYLISLAQALGIHVSGFLASTDPSLLGGRLPGPFVGSIEFGFYLNNLLAIALACWILGTHKRDRIIGAITVVATALAIVSTGTISAAIAALTLVIVSFILTRRFKMLFGTFVLGGVVVAIFFNKILPRFAHDDSSTRLFLWQEAIKLITTHPLIGIGLEQFHVYYAQLIVAQGEQLNPHGGISVHQQYLEWAMESGIVWSIIGALLLFSIIYFCWKAYRLAQRQQQVLLLATILAVLANMVISLFDVPLDKAEATVFLFLLAGLAMGYVEHVRWDVSEHKTTVHTSRSFEPLKIGIKVHDKQLPLSRRQRTKSPIQSSPSTNTASNPTDSVPNIQKTGRSVSIQLVSWAMPIPIIFIMTALLTRYLGPTQYGEYSFMLSFVAVLVLLTGYGIDPLIIRQLSQKPRAEWSKTLSYAAGARMLTTTLSVGAAILLAMVLPVSTEQRNLLLLGSISLFFSFSVSSLRSTYEIGFRVEQRISIISLIVTTDRLVTAGLVGLIVLFHLPLLWACFLILYSDLPFFFIQVLIAGKRFGMHVHFNLAHTRDLILQSLPFIGYNVMSLIAAQADLLLLMALAGAQSVGLYALASRITDPLLSIVLAYAFGLYPLFCTKFAEGHEQFAMVYREATRILALAIVPLAIFVSVEAKAIVALLGGPNFAAATIAVQLLMWTMAVTFFNQLAIRACMAAHIERRMLFITVASSAINVLANLALIPYWQIMGAGTAALISELFGLCMFTVLLRHHIRLFPIFSVVLRVFLGNLPVLLFLIWQQQAPLLLSSALAVLLAIVGCLATRTLSLKDVHLMRSILQIRRNKGVSNNAADQPTVFLPKIHDIADLPTTILSQIHL